MIVEFLFKMIVGIPKMRDYPGAPPWQTLLVLDGLWMEKNKPAHLLLHCPVKQLPWVQSTQQQLEEEMKSTLGEGSIYMCF